MKKYFAQLRPLERRLAVGVIVVLIVVLNWVFIWPHFSDWKKLQRRLDVAQRKLTLYQAAIAQMPTLQKDVKALENQGEFVAPEDQSFNFLRLIQAQAVQSGVGIVNSSRAMTRTNDVFFIEQVQNMSLLATDNQLVDFLYKLGSGNSMIRVRDLTLQPDPAHQHLTVNIRLAASYQKKPSAPVPAATTAASAPAVKPPSAPAPGSATTMKTNSKSVKPATKVLK